MSLPKFVFGGAAVLLAATAGCNESSEDGEVLATAMMGPTGGELVGGGITLTVPDGALTTDAMIEIRNSTANLSAGGIQQSGNALTLYPADLVLRLPATVTFASAPQENPMVLFRQDGLTVAANGSTAYINELNDIAVASEPEAGRNTEIVSPALAPEPSAGGQAFRDLTRLQFMVNDTSILNLAATIYDYRGAYTRPLNGAGTGECGFRPTDVLGGSLSSGCSDGELTAAIRVTSSDVEFDLEPFQAGKLDTPVRVGIVAGGDDISYQLGFFSFDTSPCFEETCSGRGECMATGDEATCVCEEGFAPAAAELACECVPQCDGRQCGFDGCGGQCAPGCGEGQSCNDGRCQSDGSDTGADTTGDPTTGGMESTGGAEETSGAETMGEGSDSGSGSGGT